MGKSTITEADLLDLSGKVVIVTGGNGGVGYGTAQWLARKGAKVYIAGRSEERVAAAIKKLESEGIKNGSLHAHKLDLADPRLAKQSAEDFLSKETRLDILVNNAAIGPKGPFSINQYGLLDIMTTNHISHFVFTETLLPLLKKTAQESDSDVRIVNVSSEAHSRCPKVESFKGKESLNKQYGDSVLNRIATYGLSKLANILHAKHLQKQFDAENIPITCISVHPGAVSTPGGEAFVDNLGFVRHIVKLIGPLFILPIDQGGLTPAFAAASCDIQKNKALYHGAYLTPVGKITVPAKVALDDRLAAELYETTKQVLAEIGL